MIRYHHDGYWYTSAGWGRHGQSISNKRWYGTPGRGYTVVRP